SPGRGASPINFLACRWRGRPRSASSGGGNRRRRLYRPGPADARRGGGANGAGLMVRARSLSEEVSSLTLQARRLTEGLLSAARGKRSHGKGCGHERVVFADEALRVCPGAAVALACQ